MKFAQSQWRILGVPQSAKSHGRGKCRPSSRTYALGVVITGSTKGIGKALAEEFVRAGDSVIVTSRSEKRVQAVVNELLQQKDEHVIVRGTACDVSKPKDVAKLAHFAKEQLQDIDIWINNAGTNSYKYDVLSELGDQDIVNIVETNVLGVMLCCREAIKIMGTQSSIGHIYNMDGAGADGNATPRFAAYGASKRGLAQFAKSLQAELKMKGVKNVCVHNLSPGMVTTELLMSGTDTAAAKFFINCLAEEPRTVALDLVPRIRQVSSDYSARQNGGGAYIKYLTKVKAYSQIFARLLFGSRKSRYVQEA